MMPVAGMSVRRIEMPTAAVPVIMAEMLIPVAAIMPLPGPAFSLFEVLSVMRGVVPTLIMSMVLGRNRDGQEHHYQYYNNFFHDDLLF